MADDLRGYTEQEVLNKVLNTSNDSIKVDITSGAEYAEDSAHATTNTGNFILGVRNDTLAALGGTDGDYVAFQMNADGALYVDVANGGVLESAVDGLETLLTGIDADTDAIKTDAAAIEVLLGTIDSDTNDIKTAVEILDNAISGTEMQVDVVAISAQSDGTYIGDIKFGESLPAGTAAIGKLAANDGVDIGDVDVTSLPASTNTIEVVGDAAEDAAVAGNPLLSGGRYDNSERTLDNGDVGALALDPSGALYVREYLGQSGSILVTGTTAVTTSVSGTKFIAIQFIEDTVFASSGGLVATTEQLWPDDTGASTTIDANGGAAIDSITFPQGMTIFGRWDGFTLASGKCIGYLGRV
tara:strand:+ start:24 stop:1091 length:1068 start_codon:yes stop_codon:yes gene_type:complete